MELLRSARSIDYDSFHNFKCSGRLGNRRGVEARKTDRIDERRATGSRM